MRPSALMGASRIRAMPLPVSKLPGAAAGALSAPSVPAAVAPSLLGNRFGVSSFMGAPRGMVALTGGPGDGPGTGTAGGTAADAARYGRVSGNGLGGLDRAGGRRVLEAGSEGGRGGDAHMGWEARGLTTF
jgi:hypothetical protein